METQTKESTLLRWLQRMRICLTSRIKSSAHRTKWLSINAKVHPTPQMNLIRKSESLPTRKSTRRAHSQTLERELVHLNLRISLIMLKISASQHNLFPILFQINFNHKLPTKGNKRRFLIRPTLPAIWTNKCYCSIWCSSNSQVIRWILKRPLLLDSKVAPAAVKIN